MGEQLNEKEQEGESGDEKFLELFAGAASGKSFRFLGFEESGAAAGFGHFLEFEFLQPFAIFQSHLEQADETDQYAEADENAPDLRREGVGVFADRIEADA